MPLYPAPVRSTRPLLSAPLFPRRALLLYRALSPAAVPCFWPTRPAVVFPRRAPVSSHFPFPPPVPGFVRLCPVLAAMLFRRRAIFRPAFPCRRRNLSPSRRRAPLPANASPFAAMPLSAARPASAAVPLYAARPAFAAVARGEIDKIFLENYGLFTMAKCTSKKLNFCLPGTPHCIFCKEQATTCSLTKKSQYL